MAARQNTLDKGQGGWFGEQRRHAEAALKGQQRETHAPVRQSKRPREIGGVPYPNVVPKDAEIAFVGTREELAEEAKRVPPDQEKMATPMNGVYVLWTRKRDQAEGSK